MHTFRVLDLQIGLVPAAAARTLGAIDTARGREDAYRMQRPQVLDALVVVARIQSTEASNAIEQVVAPRKRIEALVEQTTTPRNRSEAEIAGYRAVLDLIHEQARDIPFRPSVVDQLHRDLYQYTAVPSGRCKTTATAASTAATSARTSPRAGSTSSRSSPSWSPTRTRRSRSAAARRGGSCCASGPEVFSGGVRVVEDEPAEAQTRLRV
jgi:hypothetical protein